MADVQRLTDGVDTCDFNPLIDRFRQPDMFFEAENIATDGTYYNYQLGTPVKFYEVGVTNISAANAAIINSWNEDRDSLTFTPDLTGAPGTTYTVKLINKSRPLQVVPYSPWGTLTYYGTLLIRQV